MSAPRLPDPATASIGVIGLGYVGLPLALAFAGTHRVAGFDLDARRIAALRAGCDQTAELDAEELARLQQVELTHEDSALAGLDVYIVAVPTPVTAHKWPDLSPLVSASGIVGRLLHPGAVVIYESTVYPGATEDVCVAELERVSGLACNRDFWVGYSPERVNPGDRDHRLADIVKLTSGSTAECARFVDSLYRQVVRAGTHRTPDIRTAEAAKAIENIQRDVNIALVNELAQMFGRLGLDTQAVLDAACTKWNFLPFRPGLVGGHCIGVDPYYLIHKAQEVGHFPELIVAARRINEGMAAYVTARLLRVMALARIGVVGSRILVMGATFKEDCPDLRNTQVQPIVAELVRYHAQVELFDPLADAEQCRHEFGIAPVQSPQAGSYDAILVAVAHRHFRELGADSIRAWLQPGGVLFDVKHALPREAADGRL
ncbi:MAG TPA: nucleotide sugar dehydrogenase [Xanthomonadaceae bacterium]|nr:nucleotide sugar dehydrogenase [Xanthomonadaceae bacterium]